MGVDLYVGSISRYLAGDWQTENQQLFAKAGAPDLIQVWHADGWNPLAREEALRQACAWQDEAVATAQSDDASLRGPITPWQEDLDGPYDTKRLSPDGLAAITLCLFYEDLKDLPSSVPTPLLSDPRVAAKQDDLNLNLALATACLACDLWVPGEFPLSRHLDWPRYPDGTKARVGSLGFLKEVLDQTEQSTWPDLPEALRSYASSSTTLVTTRTKGLWPFRREVKEERNSIILLAIQTWDRLKAMTAIALERNQPMIRDR